MLLPIQEFKKLIFPSLNNQLHTQRRTDEEHAVAQFSFWAAKCSRLLPNMLEYLFVKSIPAKAGASNNKPPISIPMPPLAIASYWYHNITT